MAEGHLLTVIKWVSGGFFVVLLVATAWLLVLNRGSEKVWLTVLPAAAVGVGGAFITMLFSLKSDVQRIEFPAVMAIHKKSGRLVTRYLNRAEQLALGLDMSSTYHDLLMEMEKGAGSQREPLASRSKAEQLYHDVLFRMILNTLFQTFRLRWDVEIVRFRLPGHEQVRTRESESVSMKKETVLWERLLELFPDCRALRVQVPHLKPEMAVPVGTALSGTSSYNTIPGIGAYKRAISLKNKFVTVDLSVQWTGWSIGRGPYGWLAPDSNLRIDVQTEEFQTTEHVVALTATFAPARTGHPDMPKYHRWVNLIFDTVQRDHDATGRFQRAREELLFRRGTGE